MAERQRRVSWLTSGGWRPVSGLVGVAVVLLGAALVVLHPKQYESSATLVFYGSASIFERELVVGHELDPASQSGLARLGETRIVGDIFVRIYDGSAKRRELAEAGLTGELKVSTRSTILSDTPGHGPVLVITVAASSADEAIRGVSLVADDVLVELQRRQAEADPALSVSAEVFDAPTSPVLVSGSSMRSAAAWLALGVLMAAITAAVLGYLCNAGRAGDHRRSVA